MSKSFLEATLARQLKGKKIPFQREYRFHPTRRWRYDFYLEAEDKYADWPEPPFGVNLLPPEEPPKRKILVDVQGGLYMRGTRGKHARPAGYRNDAEKMHAAQQMGYQVIYVTADMVTDGTALKMIREALSR